MQRETISPISRCLNQHFSHYPFLSLCRSRTKIPVRRVRARALTGKKTRCEGITSIQLRRRCGFTSLCDHERKPHRQRTSSFACISFASSIYLFSLSHSRAFSLSAAAAAASQQQRRRNARRITEYGSMCLVTVRCSAAVAHLRGSIAGR